MNVVIIPSAKLIAKEMQKKAGKIPAVLYPLGEMIMLQHLVKQYEKNVDAIAVVAFEEKELIRQYIELMNMNVLMIELDRMGDLGHSIRFGISQLKKTFQTIDKLYINFADTLVFDIFSGDQEECIYYTNDLLCEEWTYFENEESKITEIWDKVELENNSVKHKVFTGVFCIDDVSSFYSLLAEKQVNNKKWDSFYQALYAYTYDHPMNYRETNYWFDIGHSENYFRAKTGVEARMFNHLSIDEKRGIIKKTSENKDKLIHEIKWYLNLPEKLKYLIPGIYNYSIKPEDPFVEMEYYGYNTLHELLVFGNLPLYQWKKYFQKLKFILLDMQKFRLTGEDASFKSSLRKMYVDKTKNRLILLKDDQHFSFFFHNDFYVNREKYHSISYYLEILPALVNRLLIDNWNDDFTIIHGDLCFSNLLIENDYGFIRMIDPRGEFGGYNIYGDKRYEIAKLMHSIEGKYDWIIEDMFQVKVKEHQILYQLQNRREDILLAFQETFTDEIKDKKEIRLIEAILFLSMIPLHQDHRNRQYAMLATGVQLLESILKNS